MQEPAKTLMTHLISNSSAAKYIKIKPNPIIIIPIEILKIDELIIFFFQDSTKK